MLRSKHLSALCAALLAVLSPLYVAHAQSFDDLINQALERQRLQEGLPPSGPETLQPLRPLQPQPGVAPGTVPGAPTTFAPAPAAPTLHPVEPGPRPYTPPAIAQPPEGAPGSATRPAATQPATAGVAPSGTPDTATGVAEPGALDATLRPTIDPATLPPGAERTRESLQPAEVNAVTFSEEALAVAGANPLILKAQVLLDRAGASPGVIDAYPGGNLANAVAAVETVLGVESDGKLDASVWEALQGDSAQGVLVQYTITEEDLAYRFSAEIPEDYAAQAALPSLAYTSPEEMLGERFHIDARLLRALNPEADFSRAGTAIWVTAVDSRPVTGAIASIVADKARRQLRAYDAQNRLIVAYPAAIGSGDGPPPAGPLRVEAVAPGPVYHYSPGPLASAESTGELTLPPGPNNPVGSTWIDLSAPGCGIHGTPDPNRVTKTAARGCVRLTNWDVEELAGLVQPGVVVSFVE